MSLVVDSSMALAWCFEDERTDHATAVLRQVAEQGALVPSLWHLEVANGLQTAIRRGRITPTFRDSTLTDLGTLSISVDDQTEHLHGVRPCSLRSVFSSRSMMLPTSNWHTAPGSCWRLLTAPCAGRRPLLEFL